MEKGFKSIKNDEMNEEEEHEQDNDVIKTSLESLEKQILSSNHRSIQSILIPNNNDDNDDESSSIIQQILLSTSSILFRHVESLGKQLLQLQQKQLQQKQQDEGTTTTELIFSGLDDLFMGEFNHEKNNNNNLLDVESIWGQVDIQNEVALKLMKKTIRKLSKRAFHHQHQHDDHHDKKNKSISSNELIRLVDLQNDNDIVEDDDNDDDDDEEGNEEEEEEEEEEDDEAARIRKRMENVMADMEGSDSTDNEDDENETDENIKGTTTTGEEEEEMIDPIAENMKDGFFDLLEMEDFADEEEAYLPEEAYPEHHDNDTNNKNNVKKQNLLPHQKARQPITNDLHDFDDNDDDDNDDEDEEENNISLSKTKIRKKYRQDDEIDALLSIYGTPNNDNDNDDDVVNMTAADFFGQPNRPYLRIKDPTTSKKKKKNTANQTNKDNDDDEDSWDNHDFNVPSSNWRTMKDDNNNDDDDDDAMKPLSTPNNQEKEPNTITKTTITNTQNEDADDGDDGGGQRNKESKFASQTKKLAQQTEELEKEAMAEKPWQMIGEARSSDRPIDSLLQSTPEFELATKAAPIITVQHTTNLEDIIKQRIMNEDWDDVLPRELPDVGWNNKQRQRQQGGEELSEEVSQEKSKLGLGELYEREYLKKALGYDVDAVEKQTEEDKLKSQMKSLFTTLCSKLDALSNYQFTPRPLANDNNDNDAAELKPMTVPAIALEESLPLHVSEARMSAPEEIYNQKKGRESVLKGDTEINQAERKRLRNAKKAARRKARKAKIADERLISKLQPGLGLNNPYEKRKLHEELSMARAGGKVIEGTTMDDYSTKNSSSSTKFFKKLQEESIQKRRRRSDDNDDGDDEMSGRKQKRKSVLLSAEDGDDEKRSFSSGAFKL